MEVFEDRLSSVDRLYRCCQNPKGVLHLVNSPEITAFDRAISNVIRGLFQRREEPTPELLELKLRSWRWDLLSDCRPPRMLFSERKELLDNLRSWHSAQLFRDVPIRELEEAIVLTSDLEVNPLFRAVSDLLDDEMWQVRAGDFALIPFGRFESVAKRRSLEVGMALSATGVSDRQIITLWDMRRELRRIDQAVLFGSPRAFGDSVVTCPIAETTHFIFYDLIAADIENDGWRHSFSGLATGLPEPHWMSFERVIHGGPYAPSGREDELVQSYAVPESEIFPQIRLRDLTSSAKTALADDEPLEVCACVLLDLAIHKPQVGA